MPNSNSHNLCDHQPLKRLNDIPGPRRIGDQWSLYRRRYRMGEILREISQANGDVARIPIPGAPKVLLSHPDDVKDVLVSNARYFGLCGQDLLRRVVPWGLIAIEGQVHDELRSLMLLTMRKILTRRLLVTSMACATQAMSKLQEGDVVDLYRFAREVGLDIAASVLFPAEAGDDVVSGIDHAGFLDLVSQSNAWFLGTPIPFQMLCLLFGFPQTARMLACRRRIRRQLKDAIAKARSIARTGPNADVLSLLTDGSEVGGRMRQEFLEDSLLTIQLAGYETTANSLGWALWEASRQPELQSLISDEGSKLSNNPAENLEWSNGADWTVATLQESLRMYPSVWTTARRTLSDYHVGGYMLPKGTFVYASQYVIQRDPRWFPEPLQFRPERWLTKTNSEIPIAPGDPTPERPQFSYFPFGGGNRFCIGKTVFDEEASLLVGMFFSQWQATPMEDCRPEPRFGVTMQPDRPMLVRIKRR